MAMNKRATIEMPDEMLKLVEKYAAGAGAAPDAYLRDVLEQHLEDLQDLAVAEEAMERLRNSEPTYTLAEVKQRSCFSAFARNSITQAKCSGSHPRRRAHRLVPGRSSGHA
ncbi:MAG: DUF6290 family protein [Pseudorhizobium sp.]